MLLEATAIANWFAWSEDNALLTRPNIVDIYASTSTRLPTCASILPSAVYWFWFSANTEEVVNRFANSAVLRRMSLARVLKVWGDFRAAVSRSTGEIEEESSNRGCARTCSSTADASV